MSEATKQLIAAVLELPEGERVAVKEALERSLAADEPDAEFEATLARRVAEIRSGQVAGAPAEELMDRLRRKYQK